MFWRKHMSLQLICYECGKTISRGTVAPIPLEEEDMKDEVFFVSKCKGYTGQMTSTNMTTDTDYPEPIICGECLKMLPTTELLFRKRILELKRSRE